MKYLYLRKTLLIICLFQLLVPELLWAKESKEKLENLNLQNEKIDLKDLALPSEVEGIKKRC